MGAKIGKSFLLKGNHEEIKLAFVKAVHKESYSAEMFAFVEKTFQERAEKEWQERLKK